MPCEATEPMVAGDVALYRSVSGAYVADIASHALDEQGLLIERVLSYMLDDLVAHHVELRVYEQVGAGGAVTYSTLLM
ncbi:MAG: hypothetical protein JST60_02415 [Chloroflexi bacterium SZAS-1]|nr:hypothetical protein [Chloroflexi bacterium SZAS-1]HNP84999.1 hypothetical protein [Kouleothrix sp.]